MAYQTLTPQQQAAGYLPLMETPDFGQNPWSGMVGEANQNLNQANNAAANIPGMQQNTQAQINSMNAYANSTQYPAMQNDYGLGSQPQAAAKADPGATSRGFNPWSLQGEALAR